MINYIEHRNPDYYEVIAEGEITLLQFIEAIKYFGTHIKTNQINILQNFSKATFNIHPNDIEILTKTTLDYLANFSSVKTASIVSEANVTALNMLYGASIQDKRFDQQPFFSRETALIWLLNN